MKKNKAVKVKIPPIKKTHIWIFFVNALIENLTFDSQTKEQLTLPAGTFGSKPVFTEAFLKGGESGFRIVPDSRFPLNPVQKSPSQVLGNVF